MSSEPAEPDKYSLDDMLDRLQSGPLPADETGELVTRADGSQAIKVRKRKRRSKQPNKEAEKRANRWRAIQIIAVCTTGMLAVLGAGALIVYTNSAVFRSKLVSKINQASGAETELIQLQSSPTAMRAAEIRFRWPDGNVLKSLTLSDLRVHAILGGFIPNRWQNNEITVKNATFFMGPKVQGEPAHFPPHTGESFPRLASKVSINQLDTTIGDPKSPTIRFLQTEATFSPSEKGKPTAVRLFRGKMIVPEWPEYRVDRALMQFKSDELDLSNLRLVHETDNNGNIELSGKINLADFSTEQHLQVKMNSFNISGITGKSLGNLLRGKMDSLDGAESQNQLSFSSNIPTGKLNVAFVAAPNAQPRLTNFTFLAKLSHLTDNPWYLDPVFLDGCTGVIQREKGIIRIHDLALTSSSQLKITGDLTLQANDVLSGTLEVGLPEALIISGKNPLLGKIFKDSRDGFCWITLKISGTGGRPIDSFNELIQNTGNQTMNPETPGLDMFDKLTAPKGQ